MIMRTLTLRNKLLVNIILAIFKNNSPYRPTSESPFGGAKTTFADRTNAPVSPFLGRGD